MTVTLKQVAERAGVSRSAVSRAFTDGASVSLKMRRKVEKAAAELGYQPNALASSLTTGRTKLIGLVSSNFHNPLFLEIFDLFTRGLQARGLRPLLVNVSDDTSPADSIAMLKQYSVDGVVIASSTLPANFAEAFRNAGVPVVHSFGRFSNQPNVHVVGINNADCGRLAVRELHARGYRRIGFMGGPAQATSTQDRLQGFLAEADSLAELTVSHSFAESYTFEAGRAEMQRLLTGPLAEAYFCGDDVLSIGAISALQDGGHKVPADVGVMGLNDMEMASWANIQLTTIRQPIKQIIDASVELVVDTLNDPDRFPEVRLFPCHLVERGTLRPVPPR